MSDYLTEQLYHDVIMTSYLTKWFTDNFLSREDVLNNLPVLYSYKLKKDICVSCKKGSCLQESPGQEPCLVYQEGIVSIEYNWCKFASSLFKKNASSFNLKLVCCNFDNYNFNDVYMPIARSSIYKMGKDMVTNLTSNKPTKGIYLYGPFGTGKSYIMANLANQMVASGHKVVFAFYPDLMRLLKSSIGTGDLEQNILELKTAEVLIFDDFGVGQVSQFIRDEVLAPIIQYRLDNNLVTCMTSNLSSDLVENYLAESNQNTNNLCASRIFERMKAMMDFVSLNDVDYRHKKE